MFGNEIALLSIAELWLFRREAKNLLEKMKSCARHVDGQEKQKLLSRCRNYSSDLTGLENRARLTQSSQQQQGNNIQGWNAVEDQGGFYNQVRSSIVLWLLLLMCVLRMLRELKLFKTKRFRTIRQPDSSML